MKFRIFPDCSQIITEKLAEVCWRIWTRYQGFKMIGMLSGIRLGRRRRRTKVHGTWKAEV